MDETPPRAPPPRTLSAGFSPFAGVCPIADRARVCWVLVSLAWVPGNFSPRHVPGGLAHSIQLLGRPLSSKLSPAGPLPPAGHSKTRLFRQKKQPGAGCLYCFLRNKYLYFNIEKHRIKSYPFFSVRATIDNGNQSGLYFFPLSSGIRYSLEFISREFLFFIYGVS